MTKGGLTFPSSPGKWPLSNRTSFLMSVFVYVGALGQTKCSMLTTWFIWTMWCHFDSRPLEGLETEFSYLCDLSYLHDWTLIKTLNSRRRWSSLVSNIPCILPHITAGTGKYCLHDYTGSFHELEVHAWNSPGPSLSSSPMTHFNHYSFTVKK